MLLSGSTEFRIRSPTRRAAAGLSRAMYLTISRRSSRARGVQTSLKSTFGVPRECAHGRSDPRDQPAPQPHECPPGRRSLLKYAGACCPRAVSAPTPKPDSYHSYEEITTAALLRQGSTP